MQTENAHKSYVFGGRPKIEFANKKGGRSRPNIRLASKISTLNPEIFCRSLSLIRRFFVFDSLPFIERGQASPFDRRDVNEDVFAAALRLDETVPFSRIEPLHGTLRHLNCSNRVLPQWAYNGPMWRSESMRNCPRSNASLFAFFDVVASLGPDRRKTALTRSTSKR
jgi:hypothetical protein